MRSTTSAISSLCLSGATCAMLALAAPVKAGEVNVGYFGNVAIKGYDPVAYFTEGKAVKGSPRYSQEWLGATWHFSGAKHRDLFAANPIAYAPQYGGYCAGGLAYGDKTVNIDPEAWRIIEGKLYLNYDHGVAAELEDIPGQLEKTEENWQKQHDQPKAN